MKRFLRLEFIRRMLPWLGANYIRFVFHTTRWTVIGGGVADQLRAEGKPIIGCFWHGRLLMMPFCWSQTQIVKMLSSNHRDGQLMVETLARFGIETIRGSSSRGGTFALRAMVKVLRSGGVISITPDGPRGPRMRAAPGVAGAALLSGAVIIPLTYSTTWRRILGSWDRFLLPLPFGRGVILWGEPIAAPLDSASIERVRRTVEDRLNALTAEADRMCGHVPVEPAPPEEITA